MAKAKADMDKEDKKEDATAAQDKAEDLQKEVCTTTDSHLALHTARCQIELRWNGPIQSIG